MKIILSRKVFDAFLSKKERLTPGESPWWSRVLVPLSWLYGSIVVVRNWFYDRGYCRSVHVGVPVISVGNITAGGTGKTPLVAMIASRLCAEGKRVAIVSRGYRRISSGPLIVSDGRRILADAATGGDEPVELAGKIPSAVIAVDARRVRISKMIVDRWKPDVILMDDGFQHRALHRDCDCVLVDVRRLPETMHMIPAGMRREPLRALQRADIIILTKWEEGIDHDKIRTSLRRYTDAPVIVSRYIPVAVHDVIANTTTDVRRISGKRCVAFCGIGSPGAFRNTLDALNISMVSMLRFKDHHSYTERNIDSIIELARFHRAEMVLTTEKDVVRLPASIVQRIGAEIPLMAVEMAIEFVEGGELFWSRLRKAMG